MSAFSALAGWADAITGRAGVQFAGARLSLAQMVPGRSAADLAELAGPGRARVDGPELDDQIVPGREAVQGPGAPVDGNDPAGAMRLREVVMDDLGGEPERGYAARGHAEHREERVRQPGTVPPQVQEPAPVAGGEPRAESAELHRKPRPLDAGPLRCQPQCPAPAGQRPGLRHGARRARADPGAGRCHIWSDVPG